MFGHGALISDVRVTLRDGTTADVLQKIYPLGRYIIGGFAGSVRIGFGLIDSLSSALRIAPRGHAWDPPQVARSWVATAKDVFDSAPTEERRLGAQFLLVGVSSSLDTGAPGFARVYVVRFNSPHFRPGFLSTGFGACSIGSGAPIRQYKQVLRRYFDVRTMPIQAETLSLGGVAKMIAHSLGDTIEEFPTRSVSRHLLVLACNRGQIVQTNNDMTWFASDDRPGFEIRMPPLVKSYAEFNAALRHRNADAVCAKC